MVDKNDILTELRTYSSEWTEYLYNGETPQQLLARIGNDHTACKMLALVVLQSTDIFKSIYAERESNGFAEFIDALVTAIRDEEERESWDSFDWAMSCIESEFGLTGHAVSTAINVDWVRYCLSSLCNFVAHLCKIQRARGVVMPEGISNDPDCS